MKTFEQVWFRGYIMSMDILNMYIQASVPKEEKGKQMAFLVLQKADKIVALSLYKAFKAIRADKRVIFHPLQS